MYTKPNSTANAFVILSMAAGMFLAGCGPAQLKEPTIAPCLGPSLSAVIRVSSTNIKVGETFTVTGAANDFIGRPFYAMLIEDVGSDRNAVGEKIATRYDYPQGLTIGINSRIISKEIEVLDLDMLDLVKGISVVLKAEQAGSFIVSFGIDGESGNICPEKEVWYNVDIHADPLTITVTEP